MISTSENGRGVVLAAGLCALVVMMTGVGLAGCGTRGPEPEPAAPEAATRGDEQPAEDSGGLQVTGLMGTIPQEDIQRVMERRLGRFQRCFFGGMERVEFLGGAVRFGFRVDATGSVDSVSLLASTVGDLETEACLLARAAEARFPRPQGGDAAEFTWGFELDGPGGVRPPVAWEPAQLSEQRAQLAALLATCGVASATLTAYVQPGGELMAAGIASEASHDRGALACVVDGLQQLTLPDPGSYPAKVTVALP